MQQSAAELADQIRRFSHDLRPTVLKHTGLRGALMTYCSEFEKLHEISVALTADADTSRVNGETALCLYRIIQEGLRNVAKHAGARRVSVTLTQAADGVRLVIVDDGTGFDLAQARGQAKGLGPVGMDERVRLLHGSVQFETRPQSGTCLHVNIPWPDVLGAPVVHRQ